MLQLVITILFIAIRDDDYSSLPFINAVLYWANFFPSIAILVLQLFILIKGKFKMMWHEAMIEETRREMLKKEDANITKMMKERRKKDKEQEHLDIMKKIKTWRLERRGFKRPISLHTDQDDEPIANRSPNNKVNQKPGKSPKKASPKKTPKKSLAKSSPKKPAARNTTRENPSSAQDPQYNNPNRAGTQRRI